LRSGGLTRGVSSQDTATSTINRLHADQTLSDWQRLFFRRSDFCRFADQSARAENASWRDVGATVNKTWGVHIGSARVLSQDNAATADCIPSAYKEVIFESKKSSPAITKGLQLNLRLLAARARRRFGITR
jgi:hypothetical protein